MHGTVLPDQEGPMEQKTVIQCPNCGTSIDVNEVLYSQLEHEVRAKYDVELKRQQQDMQQRAEALEQMRKDLELDKKRSQEAVEAAVEEQMKQEKKLLEQRIRKQLESDQADELKQLKTELDEKSMQVREFNRLKAELERRKRDMQEMEDKFKASYEAQLNEEQEKMRKAAGEQFEKKLADKDYFIKQLKNQLSEAQRKAEQGSMQMQGEVQELAIEQWLREQFPLDIIEEVKKGVRGADCIQRVNTQLRQNCGIIYYESKRTKSFQAPWIEKFKADMRDIGADIGVLVTEAMPADMERMGLKDQVWICTYEEFKGLSAVLRESLIQLSSVTASQRNRGDKMHMLYAYLTSNEFAMQIEAIVEGFVQMKGDLDAEKRAMHNLWKKREKQMEKVVLNTTNMYSSIRGIAGSAVPHVRHLELPDQDD